MSRQIEEGLLYRVLGHVRIAQDALGDAGQACMASNDQGPVGLLVPLLHPTYDPFVHVAPRA